MARFGTGFPFADTNLRPDFILTIRAALSTWICLSLESILALAGGEATENILKSEDALHILSVPIIKLRRGPEVRLVIPGSQSSESQPADPALLRLLISARAAKVAMQAAGEKSVAEVAKLKGYTNNYFTLLLRLATLAPSIVQAIIEGRQPPSLNRQRLARITNLPLDWAEQRRVLGFQ